MLSTQGKVKWCAKMFFEQLGCLGVELRPVALLVAMWAVWLGGGVGVQEKWGMRGGAMCTWEGWMGEWGGNWQLVR